jgi:predicted small lipoprotein YifL
VPRSDRFFPHLVLLAALTAALALTGCGRKGPLDLPPGASSAQPTDAPPATSPAATLTGILPNDEATESKPLAPKGQKKKLPIDWLID